MRIERNRDVTAIQYWDREDDASKLSINNQLSTWCEKYIIIEHDFSNREIKIYMTCEYGDNWWNENKY